MCSLMRRNPWMPVAVVTMTVVLVLSVYEGHRPVASGPLARPNISRRQYHEGASALPLLDNAWRSVAVFLKLNKDVPSYRDILQRTENIVQGDHNLVDMEFREQLLQFTGENTDAWDRIRTAARSNRFGSPHQMAAFCPYTAYRLRGDLRYITNIPSRRTFQSTGVLHTIFHLINGHVALAIIEHDIEAFLDALETGFHLMALIIEGDHFPQFTLSNISPAMDLLKMAEHGLNRLPLDADALDRLSAMVHHGCQEKIGGLARAYWLEYAQMAWELRQARRTAHLPPEPDSFFEIAGRRFEYCSYNEIFIYFAETWLPFGPMRRACYRHHLHRIIETGNYLRENEGALTLSSGDRSPAAAHLFSYIEDRMRTIQRRTIRPDLNVATAYAEGLFEEAQVLWPYMFHYEPYLQVLARARVTQAAIAAARYRIDRNRLPDTIEELVPEYLETIPLNPYDRHRPIHYVRYGNMASVGYGVYPASSMPLWFRISQQQYVSPQQHYIVFELRDRPENMQTGETPP